MTFIEPMITREWLLTKTPLTEEFKLPQSVAESAKDEYSVALGGWVERTAS